MRFCFLDTHQTAIHFIADDKMNGVSDYPIRNNRIIIPTQAIAGMMNFFIEGKPPKGILCTSQYPSAFV